MLAEPPLGLPVGLMSFTVGASCWVRVGVDFLVLGICTRARLAVIESFGVGIGVGSPYTPPPMKAQNDTR